MTVWYEDSDGVAPLLAAPYRGRFEHYLPARREQQQRRYFSPSATGGYINTGDGISRR